MATKKVSAIKQVTSVFNSFKEFPLISGSSQEPPGDPRSSQEPQDNPGGFQEFHLDDGQVAAGAGEGERGVVVVGGLAVDVGPAGHQELDGAEVAGPGGLHQGRATALGLVLQLGAAQ